MNTFLQNVLLAWKLPRWRWALVFALLSDIVGFLIALLPPLQLLVDAITAALLFAALGFRWPLLSVLAIEAVPGLEVFPFWTLVVAALAATEKGAAPLIADVVGNAPSKEPTKNPIIKK